MLYDYQPNRKAENAEKFLEGFSGWLHADGYQGYHRLPEQIRVVGCWAHARRKFDEALTAIPKDQQPASKAAEALCYFAKLFQMEQDFAALTAEDRFAKRLEQEKPVLEALLAWANETSARTAPKSALGKALHYLLEQWPYLVRQAGAFQQPRRAQHKALCDGPEEFFVLQYTGRCAEQRSPLQSD